MRLARVSRRWVRRFKWPTGVLLGRSISAGSLERWRLTSKSVTGRNAVLPARKPSAFCFQPRPRAVMMPAPVTTTRGGLDGGGGNGNSTGQATGFVEFGEADLRGFETFGVQRTQKTFFVHDETIAFVEDVIFAKAGRSEIHGNQICAGAEAAAVTEFWLANI